MDFKLGTKEEALRQEIRRFVKQELPQDWVSIMTMLEEESSHESWEFAMSISKKLSQKGWLVMAWPKEYGGAAASHWEQLVYTEEANYWGIPGINMGVSGVHWVGPSLMLFGSEEQKKKYLPPISSGDPDGIWCTGYSEPNAGSDFSNLQTKAVRDGNEWIINGQKVWTSGAHHARWCWLAARTNPNAPKKQQGISLFIVDMKNPGITTRPLVSFSGHHVLNEVFFDNVRVPASNLVGKENNGWYQLMQALAFERHMIAPQYCGFARRVLEELVRYLKETQYQGKPLSQNPVIRHKLAERAVEFETLKVLAYQITWTMTKGSIPTYEAARNKVLSDQVIERLAVTGTQILGGYSQIDPYSRWAKLRGLIERVYLLFPGVSIAGGLDEIQRNIIGQFKLGLPKSY